MQAALDRLLRRALRWRRGLPLAAAGIAGLAALVTGAGAPLDDALRTLRDAIRSRPASGQVAILELDARSLDAVGSWPLPRALHAQAIDRLHRAGAYMIGFDVDFSARSTPEGDRMLADALRRAGGSVVLSTFRQAEDAGGGGLVENLPLPAFRDAAFLAAVNVHPDRDGVVRDYPQGTVTAGVPRPSLAAMIAETPARSGADFPVDYAIEAGSIPRWSFIDLLRGRVPAAEIRGKRVIVGATAIEAGDRYPVPRQGIVPGVVVQALAAETLLDGTVPVRGGDFAPLLLALLGSGTLLIERGRWRRRLTFAGGAGAVGLLPLLGESYAATSFAIAPALAALGAAAMTAGAGAVLSAFERRRLEDVESGLPNARALEIEAGSGPCTVAVAHIAHFADIASVLGPANVPLFVARVAERVALGARDNRVFRIDEAALAWIIDDHDDLPPEDRFAGLAGMMRAPIPCGGRMVDVTAAFGLADGQAVEARRIAVTALAAAQRASEGGLRWLRAADADQAQIDARLSLMAELDDGLADGSVWVAYQPKLDIASGRIVGSEALVRWRHPVRGNVPPDAFIPEVEAQGRALPLTGHVLRTALRDTARFAAAGQPLAVAVNISATLLQDHALLPMIEDALAQSGVPASLLTLEVTESAAIATPDAAIARLEAIRALGVKLSIDDYGTGQSTMTYLKRFSASELKIDKSFVQHIADNRSDLILVRSTIDLAHALGMTVVAEGIEDAACLAQLAELGCDTGQGWHIGKPMTADDLLALTQVRLAA